MPPRVKGRFIEPMLLLRTDALADDPTTWEYQLKLDGYRAMAFTRAGTVHLRSRNDKDFTARYRRVVKALAALPDDTVVDGEVVALDPEGRPSFGLLQHGSPSTPIVYFLFDVLVLDGRDVMHEPLRVRRELLETMVLPALGDPIRYMGPLEARLPVLVQSVKAHGFEGLVAKRRDSRYEPGLRSGAWMKMRVNRAQAFVIGGYTIGSRTFDALVIGCYDGGRLVYAARTRNGFTPAIRARLFAQFKALEVRTCPFANLPEVEGGRWGVGLTAAKMADCRWLKPVLVGQFEFVEWTPDNHLRHSRFVALRDDKAAADVTCDRGTPDRDEPA